MRDLPQAVPRVTREAMQEMIALQRWLYEGMATGGGARRCGQREPLGRSGRHGGGHPIRRPPCAHARARQDRAVLLSSRPKREPTFEHCQWCDPRPDTCRNCRSASAGGLCRHQQSVYRRRAHTAIRDGQRCLDRKHRRISPQKGDCRPLSWAKRWARARQWPRPRLRYGSRPLPAQDLHHESCAGARPSGFWGPDWR